MKRMTPRKIASRHLLSKTGLCTISVLHEGRTNQLIRQSACAFVSLMTFHNYKLEV